MTRTAQITRTTGETDVALTLGLDGSGAGGRATGVGFLDHMLDLLARHARIDLEVGVTGDLETGGFEHELLEEFFRAVVNNARITLHLEVQAGTNAHHMIEASYKAFARALRAAVSIDPTETGVPSTKGTLTG